MIVINLAVKDFPPVIRETKFEGDALIESILDELIYQQHDLLGRTPETALVQRDSGEVISVYDILISEDGTCQKVKR